MRWYAEMSSRVASSRERSLFERAQLASTKHDAIPASSQPNLARRSRMLRPIRKVLIGFLLDLMDSRNRIRQPI
jgi:hypothetical protein